jgi:hypothetical protein
MNFSEALEALKHGNHITRKGWNGKGLSLQIIEDDRCTGNNVWIGFCANHVLVCPWTASQSDLLENDWEVIEYIGDSRA